MADDLKWMNRHAILLREPQWANLAAKENYRIRADLVPVFDAHPDSLELLDALAERKLFREGCEFIARMTHRRAAIWWGYCCLLSLFEEREAVAAGAVKPPPDEIEAMKLELEKLTGIKLPKPIGKLTPENIDDFCKAPDVDVKKLLEFPKPPPQDRSALDASSAAMRAKLSRLDSLLPDRIKAAYGKSFARAEAGTAARFGMSSAERFAAAKVRAEAGPLTYTVDRTNHPMRRQVLGLPALLEGRRKEIIATVKAAHPEKFPATPEALALIRSAEKRKSDEAVQAVWRWIVSPDERNTTLALEAGNACANKPEGLLAYAAAWSFGDLAPEGAQTVPVPPELPGTGLNSALLMMALDKDGHRKMPERYELYFNLGMEVVFGRSLWADAVAEEHSPHEKLVAKWRNR